MAPSLPEPVPDSPSDGDPTLRTFTLYLIRHGEASHNVEEKLAQKQALEECIAQGHSPDDPVTKEKMEQARQAILENPDFFDARLSDLGKEEAEAARALIETWGDLPIPQEVFVSPLQRTLQTASRVFPDHPNIHVREELRERLTGRPADNRFSSTELSRRDSFKKFSFKHLRLNSIVNDLAGIFGGTSSTDLQELDRIEEKDEDLSGTARSSVVSFESNSSLHHNVTNTRSLHRLGSSCNADEVVEDEAKLRERTFKVFKLLLESEHDSIALVTHKGYLRTLERGHLHQPNARQFQNCEVRVYQATIHVERKEVERIVRLK
jgi:broad specificity phosphatase PhoE